MAKKNKKKEEVLEEEVKTTEEIAAEEGIEIEVEGEQEDELQQLQETIAALKGEKSELNDQLLRLQAEFQNFRKRKEKESADMIRFAKEDLVKQLLPILDNFDRTLAAIDKTDNLAAIKDGIGVVDNSMRKTLGKLGLEPIETKEQEFNLDLHEAISAIPVEAEDQKGKIIEEFEKGYKLNERVIRYSKVVIGE